MLKSALTAALTLSVLSFMPAYVHGDALPATKLLPILVEADEFKVYLDEDRAVWRGNVAATQGNYTFRTGSLTVHMDQIRRSPGAPESTSSEGGNTPGFELQADNLSYDLNSGQIIGSGNTELRRGDERIRAEQIVYRVVDRLAIARPHENGRVQVQFYSDQPIFPAAGLNGAGVAAE